MNIEEHTIQEISKDKNENDRTPEKGKLNYSVLSILAYILSFICMHYSFGQAEAFSAIIPVIAVGWLYGSKAGVFCALLCFPANSILYTLFGLNWFEKLILSGGCAAGNIALIVIGVIVGRMSSLNMHLKEELYNRKRAEEKLNETKDYLDKIIESSLDGIMVTDRTGYVTKVNKYFLEILNYREEEVVGMFIAELTPFKECGTYESTTGESVEITKDFADQTNTMLAKLIEEGKVSNWESYHIRKDKKIVPVDQNIVCLYDNEGERIGSVGIIRDITERKKSENEIREAKDYLDNAFENSLDAIIITDNNGYITRTNHSFLKMIGGKEHEIIGKHLAELSPLEEGNYESTIGQSVQIGREYLDNAAVFAAKLLEGGKIANYESYKIRSDKKIVPVEANISLLYNKKDEQLGAIGIIRDITERRKAEKEIIEARNFLEEVFNTTADGIMVTDNQGCIVRVNKAMEQMLGFREDELIGKYTSELGVQSEESKAASKVMLEELFEKGFVNNFKATWCRKDRSLCPVEMSITFIKDKEGNLSGSVGAIRDISERKKTEEELTKSKDHLNDIIESSLDAILVSDETGHITRANKYFHELLGFTEEELLGKHVTELTPMDELNTYESTTREQVKIDEKYVNDAWIKIYELHEEGKVSNWESYYFRKDKKVVPVEQNIVHLFDAKRERTGSVAIIRDITGRRKMEQHLFESKKLQSLGELAGGVAHDFNNVLAAILGRVQLLKTRIKTPIGKREKRKSMLDLMAGLEIIEKASLDGAETVRRIQEFSRRRIDDSDFVQIDINELIDNALEFTKVRWRNEAESKGMVIKIKKELSPFIHITGSPSELREVFTNLINNAIDAMPQGGEIRLKTLIDNDLAVINIEDTGSGISKDVKDRIFDPFFTTKGVQSTGLGLSVSYGIINRHRGTIKAGSTKGEGTSFTIMLPIIKKSGVEKIEEKKVIPINIKQKKARILVIEDEEDVRDLLRDILTDAGHEVEVATNGNEGVTLFQEKGFDLVLTDLGMPVMSGWEVAKKVKSINEKIPVALITGWNIPLDESEMNGKGINLIIQKPFKMEQVLNLVQEGMLLRDQPKAV